MRIAVIGAGIGGLCSAAGLQRTGADVTVFERSPHPRTEGSGISVFGNGRTALGILGFGSAFDALTAPPDPSLRGGQRRPDGTWLAEIPAPAFRELRVVERQELYRMLASALTPGTVVFDAHVGGVSDDGTVRYRTPGGVEREDVFDLVVGADGLHSNVRSGRAHDPGVRAAGYHAWRGVTDGPVDLSGIAGETWGVRRRFGMVPLGDGRVYWFATETTGRRPRSAFGHDELAAAFGQWHAPIPELLATTPASAVLSLPVLEVAGRLSSYMRGRTVLVGDAAHAMTPNLGQGGNLAMEDAATLFVLLAPLIGRGRFDGRELTETLARYDRLRRPRTQRISRWSRWIGWAGQLPGPRLCAARDALLRATPPRVIAHRFALIHGWTPPSLVP